MPFPEAERVLYKKNPLDQVVCQLRFPPILKIDSTVPADFQDKVRDKFPNFSEQSAHNFEVPQVVKSQFPPEFFQHAPQTSNVRNYAFTSEDSRWTINLTRTFVALSTKKYERWEEFKEMLKIPFDALINVYSPNYFSRVGLRYIDVIQRSTLNLEDVEWSELLQPQISGVIGTPEINNEVLNLENQCEIGLSDQLSVVRMNTKLVESPTTSEKCYMIDSDFNVAQKTETNLTFDKLDFFNERARRLMQWCIKPRLHLAMEPQKL